MNFDNIYNEQFEELFWDTCNRIYEYLNSTDETFNSNVKKLVKLSDIPKIRELFDGDKPVALNEKESEKIIEYINLERENNSIEEKQCFLCGINFAIRFMKDLNLLKDEI